MTSLLAESAQAARSYTDLSCSTPDGSRRSAIKRLLVDPTSSVAIHSNATMWGLELRQWIDNKSANELRIKISALGWHALAMQ